MATNFGRTWVGSYTPGETPPRDQKGTVRPTGDGKFQAYDNKGRPLGRPRKTAYEAACTGAGRINSAVRRGRW